MSAPLSAAQMQIVEHGLVQHEPADGVEIVVSEPRPVACYYAMNDLPRSHPLANTSQGYCEVYQYAEPGEKWDGFWFAMRAYSGGASGSQPFETREEAERSIRRDVAGNRAHWDKYAAMVGKDVTPNGERIVRCNGEHYVIDKAFSGAGFGGRLWAWRFLVGTEVETRNLWSQGRIPDDYRERMPDNAVNITPPYKSLFGSTS